MGEPKDIKKKEEDVSIDIKEVPKFNLGDLPEPPKFDPKAKAKGGGFFGKIFAKKQKEDDTLAKEYDALVSTKAGEPKPGAPMMPPLPGPKYAAPPGSSIPPPPLFKVPDMPPAPDFMKADRKQPVAPSGIPPMPEFPKPASPDTLMPKIGLKDLGSDMRFPSIPEPPQMQKAPSMPDAMPSFKEDLPKADLTPPWEVEKKEIDDTEKTLKEEGLSESDLQLKELPQPEEKTEDLPHETEVIIDFSKTDETVKPDVPKAAAPPVVVQTPVADVKGVGDATAKELKRIKVTTAEQLADLSHEHIAKKTKIPAHVAKKIVKHAKLIVKKKKDQAKKIKPVIPEEKTITTLIDQLDKEKKELSRLRKETGGKEAVMVKGHDEIISLLDKLEKKKVELVDYENRLTEKEAMLSSHKETYSKDMDYIEKLKRRLDHDIRERTQYLIDVEREFFRKGQELAKRQNSLEMREQQLKEIDAATRDRDASLKKRATEIQDGEINLKAKEEKLRKLMKELEKQEATLNEKASDLDQREVDYTHKLTALEKHEKEANRLLDEKKRNLDRKEEVLSKLEKEVVSRERKVQIEDRAVNYAESQIETQKKKLEEAEFKQYLKDKLGVDAHGADIDADDIEYTQNIKVPDLQEHADTIYDLIEKCKLMTKQGRPTEAKLIYNRLRERFYSLKFSTSEEKESVHNIIRALYDEIKLAEIGNQPG